MSVFDAQAFVNTEMTGAIDTTIIPIPPAEYVAQIVREPKFRQVQTNEGERIVMDVTWGIDDENAKKVTGMEKPTCRQSIFCDVIEKDGAVVGLDFSKGKNRQLGLLREAVKQNDAKRGWAPSMLEGQAARVRIEHKPNPNDPDSPYSNVTRVTSI